MWSDKCFSVGRLQAECTVFRNVILKQFPKESNPDICCIHKFLIQNYSAAAPILITLYKVAVTCGYASARVECLFSFLTQVDSSRRRSSTPYRECALTHQFFEKAIVRDISFEEFTLEWQKKPRALNF